jgi:membrane-bound lytic murein transglycosylase D
MIKRLTCFIFLIFIFLGATTSAQENKFKKQVDDSLQYERFISTAENSLLEYYKDISKQDNAEFIITQLGYTEKDIPEFSDSIYCLRLSDLNERSPFHLDCNQHVLTTIHYFAKNRRSFTQIALARSKLYFPMYEEKLAHHNIPVELKYLSVIESGLRPQVKSRAGALGLWQFMYRTGKMYGLIEDSYIDERMDPEKATEAACLYLKKLYSMYKDWNMALAAYNAGPGNINKAIRRSGGKMTYWEIRPYLPKETQGYVPNFIAMSYMMTHYAEHNIKPLQEIVFDFELDTVCLKKGVHMTSIDSIIGISVEHIQQFNPVYKTSYIPKTNPPQCISLPIQSIKQWIVFEDSIYRLDSLIYTQPSGEDTKTNERTETSQRPEDKTIHIVRSGESLSVIARKYNTTVSKLMDWNNLKSTNLNVGQRITVYGQHVSFPDNTKKEEKTEYQTDTSSEGMLYHTIRSGDNFWELSKKYGTTVDAIERLNTGLNPKDLKMGQKVRIK